MVGQFLGHYRIEARLGAGGMGVVYRAYDTKLQRAVAIKLLSGTPDPASRARLLQEARAASALNHPNVCTVHEVGEAEGHAFIVMEYVEGTPLHALIPRDGLPVETLLRYGRQIADAVAHAHDRGILHRDLKSGNGMITADGRAKLLDFGLAQRLQHKDLDEVTHSQHALAESGGVAGTLAYMAPELLRGEPADARSDTWALGVLLYEMATGKRPFRGQTGFELTAAILGQPAPPLPSHVPSALRVLVQRCLAKDPSQRYQRASEVRVALETIESELTGAQAAPAAEPPRRASLARPWVAAALAALAIVVIVTAWLNLSGWRAWLFRGPQADRVASLAVLPLRDLSGDREQDYLVDGVTEALITELGRISALRVISRQSVMRYKGSREPLAQIAGKLGVNAVIEGSVFQVGERIRITIQLTQVAPERQLWSANYDRSVGEILSVSSEVARATAEQVKLTLTDQEQAHLVRARPANPEAQLAYLRGRYFWNRRSTAAVEQAIKEFRRAIALDSNFALAHAGLADCYVVAWDTALVPLEEAYREARAAATTALRLDDSLAEAHASLGAVYSMALLWSAAEREYRRALELNPGYGTAHRWLAINLTALGQHAEAIAEAGRAVELDPLAVGLQAFLGQRLYFAGQYDAAVEQLRKAIELDPNYAPAHIALGRVYTLKGQYTEAVREFRRAAEAGGLVSGDLGHAYALSGDVSAARRMLATLLEEAERRHARSYHIGLVFLGLGEQDRSLEWFRKAYEESEGIVRDLAVDPRLRALSTDPRFRTLLAKSGLSYSAGEPQRARSP